MSERGVDQIRAEIAAERRGLDDDIDALKSELRSMIPFLVVGVVLIGLVTFRKGTISAIKLLARLA